MKNPETISITIIGHNEEYHLRELLPALSWADEIIYVDCASHDNSATLAEKHSCRVFQRSNNPNLNVNKSFALEQATGDWLFYLDPDERIPPEMISEIKQLLHKADRYSAYQMNRRNHYFGRWLKHGSQYPDVQLRLFRKGKGHFPMQHVHERLQIDGEIGYLKTDLYHFPYLTISQYIHKFNFYTGFEADFLWNSGLKPGFFLALRIAFMKPLIRFIRRFFLKGGFRDGWPGLFAALFDALNFTVRYFKLLEISRDKDGELP